MNLFGEQFMFKNSCTLYLLLYDLFSGPRVFGLKYKQNKPFEVKELMIHIQWIILV